MSEATDDHAAGGTRLGPVLTSERLLLRRWSHVDAAPFAAMNADPEVMRYFVAPLDRAASDGLMRRIEEQFIEIRNPVRGAEAFNIEDLIDPRDTRTVLCNWAHDAYERLPLITGKKLHHMRP